MAKPSMRVPGYGTHTPTALPIRVDFQFTEGSHSIVIIFPVAGIKLDNKRTADASMQNGPAGQLQQRVQ